jgi:hypothetical protein
MPKSASPYLQRLSALLNQRLSNILRSESNWARALERASKVLQIHFNLVVAYSQRKLALPLKLSQKQKTSLIDANVVRALKDFEKILNDKTM